MNISSVYPAAPGSWFFCHHQLYCEGVFTRGTADGQFGSFGETKKVVDFASDHSHLARCGREEFRIPALCNVVKLPALPEGRASRRSVWNDCNWLIMGKFAVIPRLQDRLKLKFVPNPTKAAMLPVENSSCKCTSK